MFHQQPAHPWTVDSLAREVALSRSAFAARFAELVGEPPMAYVARWRMQVARAWLGEADMTVSQVARRLGYGSEAAINRAFKRIVGVPPGAVRARRRVGAGTAGSAADGGDPVGGLRRGGGREPGVHQVERVAERRNRRGHVEVR
jgi:AraC-like DNA-binding protein